MSVLQDPLSHNPPVLPWGFDVYQLSIFSFSVSRRWSVKTIYEKYIPFLKHFDTTLIFWQYVIDHCAKKLFHFFFQSNASFLTVMYMNIIMENLSAWTTNKTSEELFWLNALILGWFWAASFAHGQWWLQMKTSCLTKLFFFILLTFMLCTHMKNGQPGMTHKSKFPKEFT